MEKEEQSPPPSVSAPRCSVRAFFVRQGSSTRTLYSSAALRNGLVFMRLSFLVSVLSLVLIVGLVGCSSSQRIKHSGPKDAFQKGMEQYEKEEYDRAIRYFRAVSTYGRGSKWAAEAQFQLAMTQRKKHKYLVAANEFKRFKQIYRNNPKVPRAEYEQARAYYARSPRYQLDQTDTRRAIELFRLFIDRYPDHKLIPDAKEKIDELRAKLAHKQFDAGQLYERRDMWRAATESYNSVFDQYPDTRWADNALFRAVHSYVEYADRSVQRKQAERYQRALAKYEQLSQLFPDSPTLEEAKPLADEAKRKLEKVRRRDQGEQSLARESGSSVNDGPGG